MAGDDKEKPTRELQAVIPPEGQSIADDPNDNTNPIGSAVSCHDERPQIKDPNDSTRPLGNPLTNRDRGEGMAALIAAIEEVNVRSCGQGIIIPQNSTAKNERPTGEMPSFDALRAVKHKQIIHAISTPPDIVNMLLQRNGPCTPEQVDEAIEKCFSDAQADNSPTDTIHFYAPDIACISAITADFYDTDAAVILEENDPQAYIKKLRGEARIHLLLNLENELGVLLKEGKNEENNHRITKVQTIISLLTEEYECRQFSPQDISNIICELNVDRGEREREIKKKLADMGYRERAEFITRLSLQRDVVEKQITSLDEQKKNDIIGHVNYVHRREYAGRAPKERDVNSILELIETRQGGTNSYKNLITELHKWDIKSRLDLYVSLKKEYGISSSRVTHEERDAERYDRIRLFIDFFKAEFKEYDEFIQTLNDTREKIARVFTDKGKTVWLSEQGLEELITNYGTGRVVTSWQRRVGSPEIATKYSSSPSNDIPPMKHPNIVPEEIRSTSNGGSVCIAPYLKKMQLLDDLMTVNTTKENLEFLLQAIEGNLCMHEKYGLVHCDIKPANMTILDQEGGDEGKICALFDLEGAYYLEEEKNHPSIDIRTTPYYSDIHFLGIPISCYSVGRHTDTFSHGICVAEAFVGKEVIKKLFREAKNFGLIEALRPRLFEMTRSSIMPQNGKMPKGNYFTLNKPNLSNEQEISETANGGIEDISTDAPTIYVDGDLFVDFVSKKFPLNMRDVGYENKTRSIIQEFIEECGVFDANGEPIDASGFSFALETDVRLRQLSALIGKLNLDVIYFADHFMNPPEICVKGELKTRQKYDAILADFSESWQNMIEEKLFKDFCIPEKIRQLIIGLLYAIPSERIDLRTALEQLKEAMVEM